MAAKKSARRKTIRGAAASGMRRGTPGYAGRGAARQRERAGERGNIARMNRQLSALSGVRMNTRARQGRSSQG